MPPEVVSTWTPRRTQIFPSEAMAVYAAVFNHQAALAGEDVVIFVDNEAAAAALVRGFSSSADVGCIAQSLRWLLLRISCWMWIEWVDSDSNVPDGLSRTGACDEWTAAQGWDIRTAEPPPWSQALRMHEEVAIATLGGLFSLQPRA